MWLEVLREWFLPLTKRSGSFLHCIRETLRLHLLDFFFFFFFSILFGTWSLFTSLLSIILVGKKGACQFTAGAMI